MATHGDASDREDFAQIKREIIAKVLEENPSAKAPDVAKHPLWKASYGKPSGPMVRGVRESLNGLHALSPGTAAAHAIMVTAKILAAFPDLQPQAAKLLKVVTDSLESRR
jgi:hypothetical protein